MKNEISKQERIITTLTKKISDYINKRIYRILSGKYKLRKDGNLDMRFKINKIIVQNENN